MRKFPLVFAVTLLSLGACTSREYGYTTSASSYTPYYAPSYAPAYEYGYVEPPDPPLPFWENSFQFQFGGRHARRYRQAGDDWD